MPSFSRMLTKEISDGLKGSGLFKEKLLGDIQKGTVFPAIRNNTVDFYCQGGNLFKYSKDGFSTHVKFASVLDGYDKHYILDHSLAEGARLIGSFEEGYERIKEICSKYSKEESLGVSKIYHRSGYVSCREEIVVLDIEVSMPAREDQTTSVAEPTLDSAWQDEVDPKEGKRKQDRIDLLLYDTKNKVLRFYEAKYITNSDIWAKPGAKPRVVKQLNRYNEQLKKDKRYGEIFNAYKEYIRLANELFNLDMPVPETLEREVVLWLFGFDKYQKVKVNNFLKDDGSLEGLKYRFIGNPGSAADLWKAVKQG